MVSSEELESCKKVQAWLANAQVDAEELQAASTQSSLVGNRRRILLAPPEEPPAEQDAPTQSMLDMLTSVLTLAPTAPESPHSSHEPPYAPPSPANSNLSASSFQQLGEALSGLSEHVFPAGILRSGFGSLFEKPSTPESPKQILGRSVDVVHFNAAQRRRSTCSLPTSSRVGTRTGTTTKRLSRCN
eukprot:762520-Hanusia_phi.AAC.2